MRARDVVVELYRRGYGILSIARLTGLSYGRVWWHLDEAGVRTGEPPDVRATRWTEERRRYRRARWRRRAHVMLIGCALVAYVVVGFGIYLSFPTATGARPDRVPGPGEHVAAFDLSLHIGADGVVAVREAFDYDFGHRPARSFDRRILDAFDRYAKGRSITGVRLRGPAGARTRVGRYAESGVLGDRYLVAFFDAPTGTRGWTGRKRFSIAYVLRTPGISGETFDYDAVGEDWPGGIRRFTATVTSDVRVAELHCGVDVGDLDCGRATQLGPRRARVAKAPVPAGRDVTIVGRFPDRRVEGYSSGAQLLRPAVYWLLPMGALTILPLMVLVIIAVKRHERYGAGDLESPDVEFSADGNDPSSAGGVGSY
ncbi:MAG TPA: hypothetical protein VGN37_20700 [Actinocatenispora sp.]